MTTNLENNEEVSPTASSHQEIIMQSLSTKNSVFWETNKDLITNFSHAFEILSFQVGDIIHNYHVIDTVTKQQEETEFSNLYLVCQGRVRLLSFDPEKQRQVSVQVLGEGDVFGGDTLAYKDCLSYQAVAAQNSSTVQVARISPSQQQIWFQNNPEFQTPWLEATQKRQCLIFFKTLTELGQFPSHRLEKLLPYIQEIEIAQGESLAQATPAELGRFWLRQGQIQPSQMKA